MSHTAELEEPRIPGTEAQQIGPRLRSLIQRIESLEEERKTLGEDVKDIYLEAKSAGLEPKIIRALIRERRMDQAERDEREVTLDLYRRAVG